MDPLTHQRERRRRRRRPVPHRQTWPRRTASVVAALPTLGGVWGVLVVMFVVITTATAAIVCWSFALRYRSHRSHHHHEDELSTTQTLNRNAVPERLLDIWPAHHVQPFRRTHTTDRNEYDAAHHGRLQTIAQQNCIPSQHSHCREQKVGRSGTQQYVAILRPPGVLGQLLQDYVLDLVEASRNDDMDMVLKVHSAVQVIQDYTLTQLVRTTVVPFLLQAMDIVLETVDITTEEEKERNDLDTETTTTASFTVNDLTIVDVVSVVRLLIRWHCHVSLAATAPARGVDRAGNGPTALYSLNLHDALTRPPTIARELASFLHVPYTNRGGSSGDADAAGTDPQNVPLNLDRLAETMMTRVDECTRQLQRILERDGINSIHTTTRTTSTTTSTTTNNSNANSSDRVESLLEQAMRMEADQCRYDNDAATDPTIQMLLLPIQPNNDDTDSDTTGIPSSRVTQLVSSFLGDGSSLTTCRMYPRARLCHTAATAEAE